MFRITYRQALYLMIVLCFIGCQTLPHQKTQASTTILKKEKEKMIPSHVKKEPCHFKENKPRPSWIDQPPQNNQYLYGIGVAPKQSPVSNQIQAAKILAMRDISQQIHIHVKSLYQEKFIEIDDQSSTNIQSQIELSTQSLLQRVQYVDQWYDADQCSIYFLASVPKNQ
jgi:hypothetical protein